MVTELSDPDTFVDVVKIAPKDMGNPIILRIPSEWPLVFAEIRMLLEEGVDGDSITIAKVRMPIGDFAALPEHQGW